MDKILKITSQQGFNLSKAHNNTAQVQSLVDFQIPNNGVYNLKDSHVIFNVTCDETDANANATEGTMTSLIQFGILHDKTNGDSGNHQVPNVALVRNAQMSSQNKGMIESIRRVNVLRCLENSYLSCYECRNANDPIAIDTIRDANYQVYSPVRDVVKKNVVGGVRDDTRVTKQVSHDIKIPLSHIFGLPNYPAGEQFNAQLFGNTHINLEMDFSRLTAKNVLGEDDPIWATGQGACQVDAYTNASGGNEAINSIVMLSDTYRTDEDIPFFIGQKLQIELHGTGGWAGILSAGNFRRTIIGIERNQNSKKVKLTFNSNIVDVLPNGQGWDVNALSKVNGCNPATMTINVNNAELVLKEVVNPQNPPTQLQYRTHTVEEDNGNNLSAFNRQYHVEEKAMNLVVAMPNCNDGLISNYGYTSYRISIDGIDQTLRYIIRNSQLELDRKQRAYKNLGKELKNLGATVRDITLSPNYNGAGAVVNGAHLTLLRTSIVETMPITPNSKKLVGLEINGGGLGNIILFKEVLRQL